MAEVGKYAKAKKKGFKVAGLSAKQMEKATTLKGKKLTAGQKTKASKLTDISKTKWVEGKGVVGPKGKAFTGSVILPNGKTASYVNGRRVGVNAKKTAATASSTSRTKTTTAKKANATLSSAQKAKLIKDKKIAANMGAKPSVSRGQSAAGSRYSAQGKGSSSKPSTSASSGKSWWQAGGGGLVGPNSPFAGNKTSKTPKSNIRVGSRVGNKIWNGTRWVSK